MTVATPRLARVTATVALGDDTRLIELETAEPLGFVGGQYLIVDTGLVAVSGKAIKRAYSLLTGDAHQQRFQVAVKRLSQGGASAYLHTIEVGAEVRFSGPWGKLQPLVGASGRALVLATDTGITAALGLLRGARFAPLLAECTLVWLRTSPDYFLPDAFVRAALPPELREARFGPLPEIDAPERIPRCLGILREAHAVAALGQAFLAGDGAVNYALLEELGRLGVVADRDSVESFFNMPKKSAAA